MQLHPETRVLSVDGVEHIENNPYDNYFARETSYRDAVAEDDRLETKEPVYAFEWEGRQYAVPHSSFFEGGVFRLEKGEILLYRPAGVEIFYSTKAFFSRKGFQERSGAWYLEGSDVPFDPESGSFGSGSETLKWLEGFDTFWFNWSMTHPKTEVLGLRR